MENVSDECLHRAAAHLFAMAHQDGDPEAAGRAYADFFHRFRSSFFKRVSEIEDEVANYRYGTLLSPSEAAKREPAKKPAAAARGEGGSVDEGGRTF